MRPSPPPMPHAFPLAWRLVLSVLAVATYLAVGFPAVANLDIDGSIVLAVLGAVAVGALVVALFRTYRPTR